LLSIMKKLSSEKDQSKLSIWWIGH
jgi:hypothetical protein